MTKMQSQGACLVPGLLIMMAMLQVSCGTSQQAYEQLRVENDSLRAQVSWAATGPPALLSRARAYCRLR